MPEALVDDDDDERVVPPPGFSKHVPIRLTTRFTLRGRLLTMLVSLTILLFFVYWTDYATRPLLRAFKPTRRAAFTETCLSSPWKKIHPKRTGKSKWVIAYSLYGNDPRYVDPLLRNAREFAPALFPEWTLRVYHDGTIRGETMKLLEDLGVELVRGPDEVKNKMTWRFLVASDPAVERFVCRDADSYLTLREKWAIDEWTRKSRNLFHNMRDHPSGSAYTMMGGMWGGTRGSLPDMKRLLVANAKDTSYIADMNVLDVHVWPRLSKDSLQHDAFTCRHANFKNGKPFPYPRIGKEIVGAVVLNGVPRAGDEALLVESPPECASKKPTLTTVDPWTSTLVQTMCAHVSSEAETKLMVVSEGFIDERGNVFDVERAFVSSGEVQGFFDRPHEGLLKSVRYYSSLANGLSDSPFLVFGANRLLWLLRVLPRDVKIVIPREARAFLAATHPEGGSSRIDWSRFVVSSPGELYYAEQVYFVNERRSDPDDEERALPGLLVNPRLARASREAVIQSSRVADAEFSPSAHVVVLGGDVGLSYAKAKTGNPSRVVSLSTEDASELSERTIDVIASTSAVVFQTDASPQQLSLLGLFRRGARMIRLDHGEARESSSSWFQTFVASLDLEVEKAEAIGSI